MKLKNKVLLLSLLLGATTSPVRAKECAEKYAQEVSYPCKGVLLSSGVASSGLKCLQVDVPRLKYKLSKEVELRRVVIAAKEKIIGVQERALKKCFTLSQELAKWTEPAPPKVEPWYSTTTAIYGYGVVSGVSLVALSAWALSAAN